MLALRPAPGVMIAGFRVTPPLCCAHPQTSTRYRFDRHFSCNPLRWVCLQIGTRCRLDHQFPCNSSFVFALRPALWVVLTASFLVTTSLVLALRPKTDVLTTGSLVTHYVVLAFRSAPSVVLTANFLVTPSDRYADRGLPGGARCRGHRQALCLRPSRPCHAKPPK